MLSERPIVIKAAVSDATYGYDKLYSYAVPGELSQYAVKGKRAVVPFGRGNKKRVALIMEVKAEEPQQKLKPIISIIDHQPILNDEMLDMVSYLKETTLCTYFDALRTIIPAGLGVNITQKYRLTGEAPTEPLTAEENALLSFLKLAKSRKEFDSLLDGDSDSKAAVVASLTEKGVISEISDVKRRIRDETVKMVRLSEEYLSGGKAYNLSKKQKAVVNLLEGSVSASIKEVCYLCNVTTSVIKRAVTAGAVEEYEYEPAPTPEEPQECIDCGSIILSDEQQAAFDGIKALIHDSEPKCALLHGVTGSGKTAVFIKLIDYTLKLGRTAMVLIPEISLTPQTVSLFCSYFGDTVAVMHSSLSLSQRLNEYKRIRAGVARIVVGTRSAVFAPLENIGLIVIDEEGERTYKSEQAPKYHARDIAKKRCFSHNAALLLASATPSVESYYNAMNGRYSLFEMKKRYSDTPLPDVTIVDMTEEEATGNTTVFSKALADEIRQNLKNKEQTILLLNRRGYHTYITCVDCRAPLSCPNCSIPLTYHRTSDRLVCHYCGYSQDTVDECPECHSNRLKYTGRGTQRLEDEISALFPEARVIRMDADTTYSRYAYEKRFNAFGKGEYDIMVGTQMIAKGLDFPNVTLVGVLNIDKALYSGDFRSYERTFSLITQVVGRGGRGGKRGRAYIQTYSPDHYVINIAANQDYPSFYEQETAIRKALIYPPFCDICVICFAALLDSDAEKASRIFLSLMREKVEKSEKKFPLRVLGPARCAHAKINGRYRHRLIIKCANNHDFRQFISELLFEADSIREFDKVSVTVDINGDIN